MSHSHHQHDNPFFNRHRIVDPKYFWGREREVEALYSAIATGQCRSVVGERKLGKSSLLTHLSCPESLRAHGFDPDKYVFVYFDLEGVANITYTDFWLELVDRLELALPVSAVDLCQMTQNLAAQAEVRFTNVRRLLRRYDRAGLRVVLMLDEFESLAANAEFGSSFYGELRSLAGELGVVYLTASKQGLYDLTYQQADTLSSPFFNIFSEETLGLLAPKETAVLIRELSALPSGNPFSPGQIEALVDLAGPHPFFLQVAAHYLYADREAGFDEDRLSEQVTKRFKTEAEDHFRYWWRQLSDAEQTVLLDIETTPTSPIRNSRARGQTVSTTSLLCQQLHEKALLRPNGSDGWVPFSRAFADFVAGVERAKPSPANSTQSSSLTGITLGNYRVLSPIGQGGMAIVYKGYQMTLDRYVAIKVMAHHVSDDKQFSERFQREAAAVGRLRHQNIVQMLDFGVHRDITYMVMEYIDGQTLKERLQELQAEGRHMPLPEVQQIIQDIAEALDYAHAHGIVHRDVKPANIMLHDEEQLAQLTGAIPFTAVLTDFGVARMLEGMQITGTGTTIGTPDYMSPEQAQGDVATAVSDIYALGIVLFEMLTGELPFTATTPIAVLLQHIQTPPPRLLEKMPNLSPALESVVLEALSKETSGRFSTAGQMAEALAAAIEATA